LYACLLSDFSTTDLVFVSPLQVKGGKCLYTCALRPTGIYGEEHQIIKDFYTQAVERGGLLVGGVPDEIEHGRVYAGQITVLGVIITTLKTGCCCSGELSIFRRALYLYLFLQTLSLTSS